MKSIPFIFVFLGVLKVTSIQAQPLGFIEPECGIISNPAYHYENYQLTPHGFGYRLYHNGVIIQEQSMLSGEKTAIDLKFINDSIGFLVVFTSGGNISVFKINGDLVTYIGYGAGNYYSLFVVNPYLSYLVTNLEEYVQYQDIWITKCTDVQESHILIEDTSLTANITVHDSILGIPLCNNLTGIHYRYKHGNDIIVYTILFHVNDSLFSIAEKDCYELRIYPNPAREYIHINSFIPDSQFMITVYNSFGIKERPIISSSKEETELYIGDLKHGVYIIEIAQPKTKKYFKMIKL